MTFDAAVNTIVYEVGIPVFMDTEYNTWNMDTVALEEIHIKHKKQRIPRNAVYCWKIYVNIID